MADKKTIAPAQERTLPPTENQFLKGQSGNPAGRPRGAISPTQMTRKIARKMRTVKIDGKTSKDLHDQSANSEAEWLGGGR